MTDTERSDGWERRLARVVERHMHIPGAWGASDCGLTVGEAVEAVTGTNPLVEFVGRYSTELGAARIMKRKGWADMGDLLAAFFEPCGRLSAQRGDVGTILQGGQLTAGFMTDLGFATKGPNGLMFHDQTDLVAAFKVGRP